jgi:hypothetical protein
MLGEFDEVFDCPVYFRPGPLAPQPADLQTSGATSLQRIESFCERFPRANSFLQISPIIGFSDFSALLGPQFVHPKSNSFGILLSLVAERKASDPGLFLRSLAQYALKNTILDQDAFNAVIGSIEKKDFGSALSQICASSDIQPKDIEVSKTQFLIIFTTAAKRNAVLNFFSALSASNMY